MRTRRAVWAARSSSAPFVISRKASCRRGRRALQRCGTACPAAGPPEPWSPPRSGSPPSPRWGPPRGRNYGARWCTRFSTSRASRTNWWVDDMSEFFRALGQAERDRALREQSKSGRQATPPVEEPPAPEEPAVNDARLEVEEVEEVEEERTPVAARVARM